MSRIEQQWLEYPRGSDIEMELSIEDDNGVAVSMAGWDVNVFEAGPAGVASAYVLANASVSWTNQAGGVAKFVLPWGSSAPNYFTLRIRFTRVSDGHDDALDEIKVRYT